MDAGTGAQHQASRHEARVTAMEAERAALDARIAAARQQQHAWSSGAEGERQVGARLDALGPEWRVLHDIRWPGRQRANLDHVAIGPTGVWVVDAKNWSGDVSVRDGVLRCAGYAKRKEVESAAAAAGDVAALLQPVHRLLVRPVLCMAGSGADLGVHETATAARVVGVEALGDLVQDAPVCLQSADVESIADHLAAQLSAPAARSARAARGGSSRGGSTPRGKRPRPSPMGELVRTLLKLVVFLVLALAFIQTMPLRSPLLQEVFSQLIAEPMLENISEQTATTPPAP